MALRSDFTSNRLFLILILIQLVGISIANSRELDQSTSRSIRLPFKYVQSFIIVELKLENLIPVNLIFDTGAEHTIMFEKKWTDLFPNVYQREIRVIGSDLQQEIPALVTSPMGLSFGDQYSINTPLIVLKEKINDISQVIGEPVHGILSAAIFNSYQIEINYKLRLIMLHPSSKKISPSFTAVPIQIYKNKPYISTRICISDTLSQVFNLLLDTGASLSLMMYSDTTGNLQLPDKMIPGYLGSGLGGVLNGYVGKINLLQFDTFKIQEVITHFLKIQTSIGRTESQSKAGLIGNHILDKFQLIFDYQNEKLYLKTTRNYKRKIDYDKSGMIVISGGLDLNSFYIAHILQGTPAANAGLMENDQIIKINSWPTSFYSLSKINRMLQQKAGKKIKLSVRRNGQKLKFEFYLKPLI